MKKVGSSMKRARRTRRKAEDNTISTIDKTFLIVDGQKSTTSSTIVAMSRNVKKNRSAVKDVSNNHKITDFFQVRRSSRKTGKQIEEEEKFALHSAILTGSNEKYLEVFTDEIKGRGIKAGKDFNKGDFVVEYKGNMMEYSMAKKLEEKYSQDEKIGSYMYFFNYNNKKWCVDATDESPYKGRLINHSMLKPNLKTKVVQFDGKHHLILIANRNIKSGEELLYDYGDRSTATIEKNPWLINS